MQINSIKQKIKNTYGKFSEIKSAYIYGSVLSNKFDINKSDIDILFICKDIRYPNSFLEKIKKKTTISYLKLDVNVVFYNEFINRWHIYRPPTYFVGIKLKNVLLWGDNLIEKINLNEIKPIHIYKRVVDLSQGIRGVYINNKNTNFWKKKYADWLKISVLELLFLYGKFDLDFESGSEYLIDINSNLKIIEKLNNKNISIIQLSQISEIMRIHIYYNFFKK